MKWKLKLRFGKQKNPFEHFTVLADGEAGELMEGFSCPPGKAWMGMKIWTGTTEEAIEMIHVIGEQIGFNITGKIEVYRTDPLEPPGENPRGYDIQFTPYT